MPSPRLAALDHDGSTLTYLFPVPLLLRRWPDSAALNRDLLGAILSRRERQHGLVLSNVGGWHSEKDLQSWPEACVEELVARMTAMTQEMTARVQPTSAGRSETGWRVEAWANVNECGHQNRSHHHTFDGNLWSGIYYVDVGDPGRGGETVMEDRVGLPTPIAAGEPEKREMVVTPEAGLMVLFPGPLFHHVKPYFGTRPRVSIAFNMRHSGFTIPAYENEGDTWRDWLWRRFRGPMVRMHFAKKRLRAAVQRAAPSAGSNS